MPTTTVAANYTAQAGDYAILCNVTAANRTITLPSAAANSGRVYVVRRVGTGSNDCTVTPVQGGTRVLGDTFLQPMVTCTPDAFHFDVRKVSVLCRKSDG